jgi:hypothetical protein
MKTVLVRGCWPFALLLAACSSSSSGTTTSATTSAAGGAGTSTTTTTEAGGAGGASTTTSQAGGAGGATSAGGGGGGIPAGGLDACTAAWGKICHGLFTCAPEWVQTSYKDEADCAAVLGQNCAESIYGPDAYSVADEEACVAAVPEIDCTGLWRFYMEGTLPAACAKPGKRAVNDACDSRTQCASDVCFVAPGAACGKCVAPVAEGKPCNTTTKPCDAGLVCLGVCKKPGEAGADCSPSAPCHAELGCVSGKCATPIADGAACDPKSAVRECDLYHFCNASTSKCEALPIADVGAPCGQLANGSVAACKLGGACRIDNPQTYAGTCVAALASGAACDLKTMFLWNQGPCGTGESCVEGTCQGATGYHCP